MTYRMRITILGLVTFLGFVCVFTWNHRTPQTIDFSSLSNEAYLQSLFDKDPLKTLENLQSYIDDRSKFNLQTCAADLRWIQNASKNIPAEIFNLSDLKNNMLRVTQGTYNLRQSLRAKIREFSEGSPRLTRQDPCLSAIRSALRSLRYVEDYSILTAMNPKPYDPQKDPKAVPLLKGMRPTLLTTTFDEIKIRSGDLIMSRGNAYTSAAIARIGEEEAQFSHLALVYIDAPPGTELTLEEAGKDPRAYTVEAQIEIGSFYRSFEKYLQDGNARAALYRFRGSPEQAHQAAQSVFTYIKDYQNNSMAKRRDTKLSVNDNPPYDFKMNLNNPTEIFCAEIVTMAYRAVGTELPVYPTRLKKNEMTKRMGIINEFAFAPIDIEVDPHFDQLAEWRDLRKIAATLHKDAVLSSMFDWMEKYDYTFYSTSKDIAKSLVAWSMRQLDLGFSERLPKNMGGGVIRMIFAMDYAGELLENELKQYDRKLQSEGQELPIFWEHKSHLENFRQRQLDAYLKKSKESNLHKIFRPASYKN